MHEVLPNLLWIGHAGDARDAKGLVAAGIVAVVDLALEESPPRLPREMIYLRWPLLDGAGNSAATIRGAIETTAMLLRDRVPTLVCCGAGMSRSPAIAAEALALVGGEPADECLGRVAAGRPHDVSPALWNSVWSVLGESSAV